MNSTEVKEKIVAVIQEVAVTQDLSLPDLKDSQEIVDDLGFTSLGVAALIANLEEVFGIDPFEDEDVMITDIRTIKDLCKVYAKCMEKSV